MVVKTRELQHTGFRKHRVMDEEYAKACFYGYFSLAGGTSIGLKTKADFRIAGVSKGSFLMLEVKRDTGQLGAEQISAYLQRLVEKRGIYIPPVEREAEQGKIHVREAIEALPQLHKIARPIEITYLNQELVEGLLGNNGNYVLGQVLKVIKDIALEWPLDRIEISYMRDPEVKDWEYVLLLLVFTCDFDIADRYLHELYNEIDILTSRLSTEEQEVLQRMIFFDIKTRASIPSA